MPKLVDAKGNVGKTTYKSVSKAKTAARKSGKKIKYVPGKTYTK